jgi:hypothetical protein
MNNKCPRCRLVNYPSAPECVRCSSPLIATPDRGKPVQKTGSKLLKRAAICLAVILFSVLGFYLSLIFSAKGLSYEQKRTVATAIGLLDDKGFHREAGLLRHVAVFRSTDNWLNASVPKENAFAAANFPFAIITIYPDFFTYPADDIERAAILLHEAKHLEGADEKEAYEFVWRNREKLGWTSDAYNGSDVYNELRKQTRDQAPVLFVCVTNPFGDCTER